MMNKRPPYIRENPPRRNAGNIFFMLFGAVALVGAFTVGAGNVVKGLVTSISDVTRKTVAEEKMSGAARISIMEATSAQANSGDCDLDGYVEPLPYRDAGSSPHPAGGGWVPENIGASTKDPWGTEYGYCVWDMGDKTVTDNVVACGGSSAKRLEGRGGPGDTVVAIISAGKDRQFSTSCASYGGADCTGLGSDHWNDPSSGHCYWLSSGTATYANAQTACQASGGYLAVFSSGAESLNVATNIDVSSVVTYHGIDDIASEGVWKYSGGELSGVQFWNGGAGGSVVGGNYNNWEGGEPNNVGNEDCGSIGGYWNGDPNVESDWRDRDCAIAYNYMCEKSGSSGVSLTRGTSGDDMVLEYTYNDASGMSGDDLWKVMDTKPGMAKIDKNIEVGGQSTFDGPLNLMKSGLVLPDETMTAVCDDDTDQQMRTNFSANPPTLEICDDAGGNGWTPVTTGGGGGGNQYDPDLVLWYKLDESAGAVAPNAVGTTNGTLVNMMDNDWIAGHAGNGLDFDGTNDTVNAGSPPEYDNLDALTFCTWIDPAASMSFGTQYSVISKNSTGTNGWELQVYGGFSGSGHTFYTRSRGGNQGVGGGSGFINSGVWSHICMAWDNATDSTPAFYVNGVQTNPAGIGGGTTANDAAYNVVIGKNTDASYFPGKLDDMQLYKRKLTTEEIALIYSSGKPLAPGGVPAEPEDKYKNSSSLKELYGFVCNGPTASGPLTRISAAGAGAMPTTDMTGLAGFGNSLFVAVEATNAIAGYQINGDGTLTAGGTGGGSAAGGVFTNGTHVYGGTSGFGSFIRAHTYVHPTMTNTGNGAAPPTIKQMYSDGKTFFASRVGGGITSHTINTATGAVSNQVSAYTTGGESTVWSDGQYLFVSAMAGGFRIVTYDTTTTMFTLVKQVATTNPAEESFGDGKYLYVSNGSLISVYTFDGANITHVTDYNAGADITSMRSDGTNIFISVTNTELRVLRFNGIAFSTIASQPVSGYITDFWSNGTYLFALYGATGNIEVYTGYACGASSNPPPAVAMAADKYRGKIAVSWYSACGIKPDKSAWCWGDDANLMLGNGTTTTTDQVSPSRVDSSGSFVQITVGCGLKGDGSIWCWGDDADGQIGNGATTTTPQASPVAGPSGTWTQVTGGTGQYSCGIRSDGVARCWGRGTSGQLGNSGASNQTSPVTVSGGGKWVQISAGLENTCGIKTDGSAWCWGKNNSSQLGNGGTTQENAPVRVAEPGPWAQVSAGDEYACGVKLDGTGWCWGKDNSGRLGISNGTNGVIMPVPTRVSDLGPWLEISASAYGAHTCGVKIDGSGWCWGIDYEGSLGDGAGATNKFGPTRVADPGPWATIVANSYNTCGIKTDGSAWCWGDDATGAGQLGNGGVIVADQYVPSRVVNFPNVSPWTWTDSGRTITASGSANINMGRVGGISFDGTSIAGAANGLSFPSAGQSVLRQNPGGSDLLLSAWPTASSQISWKAATAANTRSIGIDYVTGSLDFGLNNATPNLWMNAIAPQMEITPTGNVGIGTSGTVYYRLEVNGGLRIGNDTSPCTLQKDGVLRYNSGLQFCKGSTATWTNF